MRKREPWSDWEDAALLAAYRRDPEGKDGRAAVSELFGRYRRPLYRWCFRYAREHERALDLAQETLVEAFGALQRFEGRARFSSWLFAIARYRCLSAARARRFEVDAEIDLDSLPASGPDPEEEVLAGMEEDAALRLIESHLDPLERQAVWMRYHEALSVPEITRMLELRDRSGARGLLQRARRKLRSALNGSESPKGGHR